MRLSDLHLTEVDKALLTQAVDTHMRALIKDEAALDVIEMFEALYRKIVIYNTKLAEEIVQAVEVVGSTDEHDEIGLEELTEFVDALGHDEQFNLYEVLCRRIADCDEIGHSDVPEKVRTPKATKGKRHVD